MPAALDRAEDKCYRPAEFRSDCARVEYLFQLYEQLTAPLGAVRDWETQTHPQTQELQRNRP